VILSNGHYCLIRDKYVNADGDLIVHAEYWLSSADCQARPDSPREAHDHLQRHVDRVTGERTAVNREDAILGCKMLAMFNAHLQGEGPWPNAVRQHPRHTSDPYGWLDHPFVQSLEVTPRV
jgi:hypothetical protein